ncbi:hypothetical protein K504DRAFT_271395 [Pleomassaria siparia CBS 279.74]|uniref:Uncharacterized protein n=1 Tax=Pleomassaria siparia CBS 279.74 TaxID=1314801 RepID=A0A6G1K8Z9_9PLEO|nr:hypothetical protein K504DRAFT_271395 [Pleomassaria siparia CBS 279.74]
MSQINSTVTSWHDGTISHPKDETSLSKKAKALMTRPRNDTEGRQREVCMTVQQVAVVEREDETITWYPNETVTSRQEDVITDRAFTNQRTMTA